MKPLTKFLIDVNNIQKLSDQPNTADGLTAQELKEKFDKAGADIKDFINTKLTNELDSNIDSVEKTANTLKKDIDLLKIDNTANKKNISSNSTKITSVETKANNLEKALDGVSGKVNTNTSDITNLKNTTSKNTSNISSLDIRTTSNEKVISENYLKIATQTSRIDTLNSTTVKTSDGRLTNSRTCNNYFDGPITARNNLKIKTGTYLPGSADEDTIFLVY